MPHPTPLTEPGILSPDELARYHRQTILPEVGEAGQRRLKAASVLLIGVGGLGCPAALYLATAGIGKLTLVDPDTVDASNLHRQTLYAAGDLGRPKVEAAAQRLLALNPALLLTTRRERFDATNARELVAAHDLVIDGADNFATRYLVNDACVLAGRPNVHGSISRFTAQVSVYGAAGGPCYRCLYPEPPPPGAVPGCAEAGVLGVLPGLVGLLQATEAIKLILGIGESLIGRVLLVDALSMHFREIALARDPGCPLCGDQPTIDSLHEYDGYCTLEPTEAAMSDITPSELRQRLAAGHDLVLLDVRGPAEWAEGHLDDALHIPLGALPDRHAELDPQAEIVVYCKMGGRSARAAEFLRAQGHVSVHNLVGGILAWNRA